MTTVPVVRREEGTSVWLKSCVETAGFRVITARDGLSALDLARRERPALILLNLMPPAGCCDDDGDGAEMDVCEFLCRLHREREAGAIVLSDRDDEAIKVATLESGAGDYSLPAWTAGLNARRATPYQKATGARSLPWASGMQRILGPAVNRRRLRKGDEDGGIPGENNRLVC